MKKLLSVIIPCFNHGKFLQEALSSIDSLKNRAKIEVIIINDGSTDEYTNTYIASLDKQKYEIINQPNQGLARSRNNGVLAAKSEYVLMLDADNFINEQFIVDYFHYRENNIHFDALYGNALCFGDNDQIMKPGDYDLYRIIHKNYIDACAIFNKEKIISVGLYDDDMPYMGWEDWDLWIRLGLSRSNIMYNNRIYFHYRVLQNSMIRSHGKEQLKATVQYIHSKNKINIQNIDIIIEHYVKNDLSAKSLFYLIAKKFTISRKYCFKISKPESWKENEK